ncbi:hypothetical protein ACJJTC_006061 [Scirpophaga incertulas]
MSRFVRHSRGGARLSRVQPLAEAGFGPRTLFLQRTFSRCRVSSATAAVARASAASNLSRKRASVRALCSSNVPSLDVAFRPPQPRWRAPQPRPTSRGSGLRSAHFVPPTYLLSMSRFVRHSRGGARLSRVQPLAEAGFGPRTLFLQRTFSRCRVSSATAAVARASAASNLSRKRASVRALCSSNVPSLDVAFRPPQPRWRAPQPRPTSRGSGLRSAHFVPPTYLLSMSRFVRHSRGGARLSRVQPLAEAGFGPRTLFLQRTFSRCRVSSATAAVARASAASNLSRKRASVRALCSSNVPSLDVAFRPPQPRWRAPQPRPTSRGSGLRSAHFVPPTYLLSMSRFVRHSRGGARLSRVQPLAEAGFGPRTLFLQRTFSRCRVSSATAAVARASAASNLSRKRASVRALCSSNVPSLDVAFRPPQPRWRAPQPRPTSRGSGLRRMRIALKYFAPFIVETPNKIPMNFE